MIQAGLTTIARCRTWLSPGHCNGDRRGAIWNSMVDVGTDAITSFPAGEWNSWALLGRGFMDDFGSLIFVDGGLQ